MRTTIDLDPDVLNTAKQLAAQRGSTLGKVLSDLARQSLSSGPGKEAVRNGMRVFAPRPGAKPPTLELINQLRDEE